MLRLFDFCRQDTSDFPCKYFMENSAVLLEREASFCRFGISLRNSIFCLITEIRELNEGVLVELQAIWSLVEMYREKFDSIQTREILKVYLDIEFYYMHCHNYI